MKDGSSLTWWMCETRYVLVVEDFSPMLHSLSCELYTILVRCVLFHFVYSALFVVQKNLKYSVKVHMVYLEAIL